VERELAPVLAAHGNWVYMHAGLFKRIDALVAARETLGLTASSSVFSSACTWDFVRAGARLAPAAQKRYAQVMERLAELTTRFTQNVLADEANNYLVLRTEAELAGLPDFVRAAARQAAADRGLGDAWVITLSRSHVVPFLTFCERRDLREQAWRAWTTRGEHDGAHDNRPVAREILALRASRRACTATPATPTTRSPTRWPARAARRRLLQKVWVPAKASAERSAGAAGHARRAARRCDRGLGLALLRREGAPGALRPRRGRGQAVLPARPHGRGGVRLRRAACSACASSRSRDVRPTTRREGLRGARTATAPSASSCMTTTRGPASAAAPG
jgi:hypothetical protein